MIDMKCDICNSGINNGQIVYCEDCFIKKDREFEELEASYKIANAEIANLKNQLDELRQK